MSKINRILNIVINSLLIVLTIVAVFLMFYGENGVLTASRWKAFRYFTVQSNLLVGIVSGISLFYLIFFKDKYPLWLVICKLAAVTSVAVTFMTVMVYLGPLMGYDKVFLNANLFMHLIIPLLSIAHFILIEPKIEFKFIQTLYAIIPVSLYGIIYQINVAAHNDYGNIDGYDWYGFGTYGLGIGMLALIGTISMGFGLAVAIYFPYQKTKIKKFHE